MLLSALGTSLLGDMLTGKTKITGRREIRAGEGTITVGQDL